MSIARHHAEWLSLVEVSGPFLSLPVLIRVFPQGLDGHDTALSRTVRQALAEWQEQQQELRPDPAMHLAWLRFVLVYLDEATIERQPTVAAAFAPRGREQPRARRSHASDTLTCVVASLTHTTGQVVFRRASTLRLETLVQFYQDLCAVYPTAEQIVVVQDNWPVHTHPDVLAALEPQTSPSPSTDRGIGPRPRARQRSENGTTSSCQSRLCHDQPMHRGAILIEKLWRTLRQEVTPFHRWSDDLIRPAKRSTTF